MGLLSACVLPAKTSTHAGKPLLLDLIEPLLRTPGTFLKIRAGYTELFHFAVQCSPFQSQERRCTADGAPGFAEDTKDVIALHILQSHTPRGGH